MNTPTYFCYPDNEVRGVGGSRTPYHAQKATENWLRHFENSLYLTFLVKAETDFAARARAQKELGVAANKMEYWQKHPNFELARARLLSEPMKKMWERRR